MLSGKVTFTDSAAIDVDVEEKFLAARKPLPKDAAKGAEFIPKEDRKTN